MMRTDNIRHYNVAGVNISIEGKGQYADAFRNYFRTEEVVDVKGCPSLRVIILNDPADVSISAKYFSLSGKISFNDSEYCIKKNNFIYSVSHLFSATETVVLRLCYTGKKTLKNKIGAFLLPNNIGINNSRDEFVDSVMNYEVFWYIFAIVLMRYDKVFVHSSIIERNGEAFVLAGTGGCGKTSTLLNFMEKEGYKYLAEDFGILGHDGYSYYTPKRVAVYQSDARYKNEDVIKALKRLPVRQQLQWKFLVMLGKNPRYRFTPQQLFGVDRIAQKGKLRVAAYMSRVHGTTISSAEMNESELCKKIRHAAFRELKELYEIINNIRAVGDEHVRDFYPEISQIEREYEQILEKIFQGVDKGILKIPLKAVPEEIMKNIVDLYLTVDLPDGQPLL